MEYPFRISLGCLKFDALSWDGYFRLMGTVSTVLRFVEICDVLRVENGWIVSPPLKDAARLSGCD